MHNRQYQMAIFVTPESEDDPEWPNKRKWFDASKWLQSGQYIKLNDFYLLNLKYFPIDDLHQFGITRRLQKAIKDSLVFVPDLASINNMGDEDFFHLMKNNLSYEYLRSEFNKKTLEPTFDYFLIFFIYKGEKYEVQLIRQPYKNDFIFKTYASYVHKAGYWHSTDPAEYSYRDYLAGKPIN